MKNTIYILAKQSNNVQNVEKFGIEIGEHFLKTYSHVTKVKVSLIKHRWGRMMIDGKLHKHSFVKDGEELRHAKIFIERQQSSNNYYSSPSLSSSFVVNIEA